jgi:hypothetical protein
MDLDFDFARLRRPEWLMGGGALALFIAMFFFQWFGTSLTTTARSGSSLNLSASANAWHSLHNTRWVLLLTVLAALAAVIEIAADRSWRLPVPLPTVVTALATISSALVLYRIFQHPHGDETLSGIASFKYGAQLGLYLGFLACLATGAGGYLTVQAGGGGRGGPTRSPSPSGD